MQKRKNHLKVSATATFYLAKMFTALLLHYSLKLQCVIEILYDINEIVCDLEERRKRFAYIHFNLYSKLKT